MRCERVHIERFDHSGVCEFPAPLVTLDQWIDRERAWQPRIRVAKIIFHDDSFLIVSHDCGRVLFACIARSPCQRVRVLICTELWIRRFIDVFDDPPFFVVKWVDVNCDWGRLSLSIGYSNILTDSGQLTSTSSVCNPYFKELRGEIFVNWLKIDSHCCWLFRPPCILKPLTHYFELWQWC